MSTARSTTESENSPWTGLPDESLMFDRLTGPEFLEFVGRMYGLARPIARERSRELLALFELSSETLLPTRIFGRRIRAANIATDDTRKFAQFSKRPLKIGCREAAALPVRRCLFDVQAVEIDRDVDIFARETFRKFFKTLAPGITQDGALPLLIFQGPSVRPRMDFKNSGAFSAPIAEDLVRPPTFEIAAAPNTGEPNAWNFQSPVDPTATGPFRRAHIPIGMIIKGYEDHRFGNRTQSERC